MLVLIGHTTGDELVHTAAKVLGGGLDPERMNEEMARRIEMRDKQRGGPPEPGTDPSSLFYRYEIVEVPTIA